MRTRLTASRPTSLQLAIPTAELVAADTPARTMAGLAVPYGATGSTSIGPARIKPGAIQLPADLHRVKLVDEHQNPPRPIGYLTSAQETPEGLRTAFHVASTPAGDAAMLEASERVRDAFSIELSDIVWDSHDPELVISATLTAVALVTVPAFADARVDRLAAALNPTPEGTTPMTPEQRARLAELLAAQNLSDADRNELNELTQLAVQEMAATPDAPPADAPPADAAAGGQLAAGAPAQLQAAQVPGGLQGPRPGQSAPPITELFASMARVFSGRSRPEMEAALSNITSTANIWTGRDDYAGQLWSGLQYNRRFVPLLSPGRLTSYKGTGWRWVVKPAVADYAGDKAAVPSNAPSTEAAEYTAARLAGAHDLDRKFVDFGDTEFIEAYYTALRESYAAQSDTKARAFILASAVALGSAGVASSFFRAVAFASQAMQDATNGATVDYVLVNSTDLLDLIDVTEQQLPAYLEMFGITPDKFHSTPGQAPGSVTVGTRQAGTFYELGDQPIRVEAVNIVNGGVDGGVFGYYATLLNHEAGIQTATFG